MYFNYNNKRYIIQVEGGKNMIIGICGKSGCGKSTLANQIKKFTYNKAMSDIKFYYYRKLKKN